MKIRYGVAVTAVATALTVASASILVGEEEDARPFFLSGGSRDEKDPLQRWLERAWPRPRDDTSTITMEEARQFWEGLRTAAEDIIKERERRELEAVAQELYVWVQHALPHDTMFAVRQERWQEIFGTYDFDYGDYFSGELTLRRDDEVHLALRLDGYFDAMGEVEILTNGIYDTGRVLERLLPIVGRRDEAFAGIQQRWMRGEFSSFEDIENAAADAYFDTTLSVCGEMGKLGYLPAGQACDVLFYREVTANTDTIK